MDIRSIQTIKTPENAFVEIELAGVGNRIFAMIVDLAVMLLLMVLTVLIGFYTRKIHEEVALVLFYTLTFVVVFGYHFFLEWLWNGQSAGKALLNIRVVRDNGQPIGLWESFGRNLLRIVDVWMSGVGLLPLLLSRREKRFGDFLAGTLVINDQKLSKPVADVGLIETLQRPADPDESIARLASLLAPEEYDLLQDYLARRPDLTRDADKALEADFRSYFKNRLQLSDEMATSPDCLLNLYFGYRALEK